MIPVYVPMQFEGCVRLTVNAPSVRELTVAEMLPEVVFVTNVPEAVVPDCENVTAAFPCPWLSATGPTHNPWMFAIDGTGGGSSSLLQPREARTMMGRNKRGRNMISSLKRSPEETNKCTSWKDPYQVKTFQAFNGN